MKKTLALLLCLILCLSLFACNASEEPTEAPAETERAAKTEQGQSLLDYYSAFGIDAQDVRELILDAEDIRSYPYYDKDTLEPNGRFVFAVYDGGTVSNVFVADPLRRTVTHEDDENNRIILRMNDCIQKLPQFIIEGFIEPNSMFSFFGRCGVGEPLKLCMQGCCSLFDFLGVANEFYTMEEGARLRAEHNAAFEKIEASIPRFSWNKQYEKQSPQYGYYRFYGYAWFYDEIILCPLLTEDGSEGRLMCHLLYYKGRPVGEVVCNSSLDTVWESWGDSYDENGTRFHRELTSVAYIDAINNFKELYPDKEIKGVSFFDGQYKVIEK